MNEPIRLSASGNPLAKQLLLAGKRERPRREARSEAIAAALQVTSSRRSWLSAVRRRPWLALLGSSLLATGAIVSAIGLHHAPSSPGPALEAELERPISFDVPPRVPESFLLAEGTAAPSIRAPAAQPRAATAAPPTTAERPTELELLRNARIALVNGDPTRTLAWLDEHTNLYPRGALREEAAAVRVEAHARSGDTRAARAAAARFAELYPASPYGERIRSIAASLPRP